MNPSETRRDRFASIENYSGRYTASSSRPPLSTSEVPSRRHVSVSLTDTPLFRRGSTRPATHVSTPTAGGLVLKPWEVRKSDYHREDDSEVADEMFFKAYRHRAEGDFESAAKQYSELLQVAPSNVPARVNLGVCFMKLGQLHKASEVYEPSVESACTDCRLLYNYAILKIMREDQDSARQALDLALKTATGSILSDITNLRNALELRLPRKRLRRQLSDVGDFMKMEEPLSLQSISSPISCVHSKNQSFSVRGATPSGCVNPPRLMMWGVFKTVDQYAPRPASTVSTVRDDKKRRVEMRRKVRGSFITSPKIVKSHKRRRSDESEFSHNRASSLRSTDDPQILRLASFKNQPLLRVRMHGALLEEDLEDEKALRSGQVDQELEFSVRSKAVEVGGAIRKEMDKLYRLKELLPQVDLNHVLPMRLSSEAQHLVQMELRKKAEDRDYELLLKEVSKLKFFAKFQTEVRRKFLQISQIHTALHHEIIFSQGDFGNFMYVILRGSVTVTRHSPEFGNDPLIVHTLYDGESFGELGLFSLEHQGKPEGRSASCHASEITDLLLIPKAEYHSIMLSEIENQLEQKIKFLEGLPFFVGAQQTHLIPLASNLDPQTFSFSDAIVRKGDKPNGLYVILSGYCNLYSEGFCLRPKNLAAYASARIRTPQPLPFRTGNSTFHSPKRHNANPEAGQVPGPAITLEELERNQGLKGAVQGFFKDKELPLLMKDHYVTQERIFKKALKPKDFFAGRALLEGTLHDVTGRVRRADSCKYSVVAESATVQVICITRAQLLLLSERLIEQIRKFFSRVDDCDCPEHLTEKSIESEFRSWARYKARLLDQTRRQQFADRSENRTNPSAAI